VFATPADDPAVTVVVVTYNGARWLPRCLDALAAQQPERGDQRVACWVVDNASSDGTATLLAARTDGVRTLRAARNLGFAGGNNLALREVTTPYAVLLNDDAVPEPGWLDALLAGFREDRVAAVAPKLLLMPRFARVDLLATGTDRVAIGAVLVDGVDVGPDVVWDRLITAGPPLADGRWCRPVADLLVPLATTGTYTTEDVEVALTVRATGPAQLMVGGTRHAVDAGWRQIVLRLPAGTPALDVVNSAGTVLTADGYAVDRGYGEPDGPAYDVAGEAFGGCGAALALRMAALRDTGMFDDDWFLYYEDVDLCWRLRRRGWTVRYQPEAVVRHQHSATVGTRSDLHVFHDHRNRLLTLTKNASLPLLLRTAGRYPLTTASMGVRAAGAALTGAGSAPLRAVALRLRVIASYLRLLSGVWRRRRALTVAAVLPASRVEQVWVGTGPPGMLS